MTNLPRPISLQIYFPISSLTYSIKPYNSIWGTHIPLSDEVSMYPSPTELPSGASSDLGPSVRDFCTAIFTEFTKINAQEY